jgi:hypothetical protein
MVGVVDLVRERLASRLAITMTHSMMWGIAALAACVSGAQGAEPRPEPCRAERAVTEGLPKSIKARIGRAVEMAPCVVASLPEPVREALAASARQRQLNMADPGQPWASSDVVPRGMPRQQLVRAAHSADVWVIDYHKGGFFSSYVVTVVGVEGEHGRPLWTGQCHRGRSGRGKWRCTEAVK